MTTFTPQEYVKIDIANQAGKDKLSFAQRIAWVDSIKDLHKYVDKAEKPAQFLAAVYALEDSINKVPSGHLVEFDAAASGVAIMGVLTGCHVTSSNTGTIGNKRMDFYGECTKAMNGLLIDDIEVSRKDTKRATMTTYYGSKHVPKEVFGEDTDELMAFYAVQESLAPGACYMMKELLDSWQPYALSHSFTMPDGFNAIIPVLQKCKLKVEVDELNHACISYIYEDNIGSEKGLSAAANAIHGCDAFLVREVVRRCNYDEIRLLLVQSILKSYATQMGNGTLTYMEDLANKHGFLSLRAVEFIDLDNVLDYSHDYRRELIALIDEVLSKPRFDVVTIHDAYKSHAKYMNYLRECYMTVLAELADSTVGQQIIREIRNDPSYVLKKLSDTLGDQIVKGDYWLS